MVFASSARRVRFARRCDRGLSSRPHHCARFGKSCAMLRSNRPCVAAAPRESHASHAPCESQKM
eukprot:8055422-Lingulodinium_polyedra.AAC.1